MNIHLPAILMFTRGTRFWHTAIWYHYKGIWWYGRYLRNIVIYKGREFIYGLIYGRYLYLRFRYIVITTWCYLVGGLEHVLVSPIVWMMIQSDFHIFQRGRYTTNQRRKIKKIKRRRETQNRRRREEGTKRRKNNQTTDWVYCKLLVKTCQHQTRQK